MKTGCCEILTCLNTKHVPCRNTWLYFDTWHNCMYHNASPMPSTNCNHQPCVIIMVMLRHILTSDIREILALFDLDSICPLPHS